MSNPLLRPNDPRFQKPDVRGPGGQNRFAEDAQATKPAASGDVFAAAAIDDARPFVPRYEVQQQPRTPLLFLLGGLGWAAAAIGAISLTGVFDLGWISPLIGIGPAAAAWFLGFAELRAIHLGAIAQDALSQTRYAFWLGVTALLACFAVVGAMIYRQMHFLPDVF
jgi:hypothetical protein